MNVEITPTDPLFDFDNVYKRNYSTLLNIAFMKVQPKPPFLVDTQIQTIPYSKKLYCVMYKEWPNTNWFELQRTTGGQGIYWSSVELAKEWFGTMKAQHGLELLSRDEAMSIAQNN